MASDANDEPLPPTGVDPSTPGVKTLFPKIGRPRDALDSLRHCHPHLYDSQATVQVQGTVKLHGQHADVVFLAAGDDVKYQSRNVHDLVAQGLDINDFAKFMSEPSTLAGLLEIRDRVKARYLSRCDSCATAAAEGTVINPNTELVLQGEWIGQGIQKGVAISSLKPCWVIYGVSINGRSEDFRHCSDIECPELEIYNIHRVPTIDREIKLNAIAWSLEQLQLATDEVIEQCPFAASRGIKGKGEGIVWKIGWMECEEVRGLHNHRLWFKMKGRVDGNKKFIARIKELEKKDPSKKSVYERLAEEYATEDRVEKAAQYVRMECKPTSLEDAALLFEEWMARDVMIEEAKDLADLGYSGNPEVEKEVRVWARCHAERTDLGLPKEEDMSPLPAQDLSAELESLDIAERRPAVDGYAHVE